MRTFSKNQDSFIEEVSTSLCFHSLNRVEKQITWKSAQHFKIVNFVSVQ